MLSRAHLTYLAGREQREGREWEGDKVRERERVRENETERQREREGGRARRMVGEKGRRRGRGRRDETRRDLSCVGQVTAYLIREMDYFTQRKYCSSSSSSSECSVK
jgi:hypothetical protein